MPWFLGEPPGQQNKISQVHYSTERTVMGNILGEILMGVVKICEGADLEKVAEECTDKIIKEMSGAGEGADAENSSGSGERNEDRENAFGSDKENRSRENASGSSRKDGDKPAEQRNCAADEKASVGREYENFLIRAEDLGTFRVSIAHEAGGPGINFSVTGNARSIFNGIANLLEYTALTLADGKAAKAAMIAGEIGEAVKEEILSGGTHNEED